MKENMRFSLSNARERPLVSGGMEQARMYACPVSDHEFNFFRLFSRELRAFAVVRYVYVVLVPLHHASHTIPRRATPSHATLRRADSCHTNALHHDRIARKCIRCCSASFSTARWTERRACVRCAHQDGTFHRTRTCFFFARCIYWFTIHLIYR